MTYEVSPTICSLAAHVETFIQERRFLRGVTESTLAWYANSFKAFGPVLANDYPSSAGFKAAVVAQIGVLGSAGRGNKAVLINTYLRCLKAFLNWRHQEKILPEPIKLSWLKEEQKILATLSPTQLSQLLKYSPKSASGQRTHAIACVLLDTGMRISEALGLSHPNGCVAKTILPANRTDRQSP